MAASDEQCVAKLVALAHVFEENGELKRWVVAAFDDVAQAESFRAGLVIVPLEVPIAIVKKSEANA
jgi:hypothetical protein